MLKLFEHRSGSDNQDALATTTPDELRQQDTDLECLAESHRIPDEYSGPEIL